MKWTIVAFVFSLCMYACIHAYTEENFKNSKWIDSNGGIICLYKNGVCSVQGIRWDLIYPSSWFNDSIWKSKHPNTFVGHWYLDKSQNGRQEIYIKIGETGYGFSFEIRNIETIECLVGDPDNCEFYIFNRVNQ